MSFLREKLELLAADVAYVEVTRALASRAGDLAEEHHLRGYDAVHLASVLEIDADDAILVTADRGLAAAGHGLGIVTARLPAQSSAG